MLALKYDTRILTLSHLPARQNSQLESTNGNVRAGSPTGARNDATAAVNTVENAQRSTVYPQIAAPRR